MPFTDQPEENTPPLEPASRLRQEAMAWVVRLAGDSPTDEDRRRFTAWKTQSPAHANAFEAVSTVWHDQDLQAAAMEAARSRPPRLKPAPVRRWTRYASGVAAAALLLAATLYLDLITSFQADHRTGTGEQRTIQLPDRSLVTLNTQTAIALSFNGKNRQVHLLKGEAFFKVQSNPDRPFIVDGPATSTRAVGTAFVVRAQGNREQITVIEGIVAVENRSHAGSPIALPAGSQVDMEAGRMGSAHPVDLSGASAWLRGRLVVDGMPLAQVLDEIRRYYPGAVWLLNPRLGEQRVTGTYNLADPAQMIALLATSLSFRTAALADRVILIF